MKVLALLATVLLAGCVSATQVASAPVAATARPVAATGLDRVLGQNARALSSLFGAPASDYREGVARKLQFANGACVLDAYLYAAKAGAEPVVTHIDTRLPTTGSDIDRLACITALSNKPVAR